MCCFDLLFFVHLFLIFSVLLFKVLISGKLNTSFEISLVAQLVKNPPATQDTWVRSPGWGRLPTPVFWPGEFHGLYSPWGCKESDTTERLSLHFTSLHFTLFLDFFIQG